MKTLLISLLFSLVPGLAVAAGGSHFELEHANNDLKNKASLQRGAKLYVNYCMGCHSAEYQRYSRFITDMDLTEEQISENLIFTGGKVGDLMRNAMPAKDAKDWFGAPPPDLTLIARSRGVDYLYTYLTTFYLDPSRPFGVNNAVFPLVGMPHALWELQGWQEPVFTTSKDAEGNEIEVIEGFELVQEGSLDAEQYSRAVRDLVNFLAYIAEPVRLERESLGIKVLLFLVLVIVVFYLLKKEYWKDVH